MAALSVFINDSQKFIKLILLITISTVSTQSIASYLLRSDIYAYARTPGNSPIAVIKKADSTTGGTTLSGDFQQSGSLAHNLAGANYFASLNKGLMSAQTFAESDTDDEGRDVYAGTGRVKSLLIQETLTFSIPAGIYSEGVEVFLNGRVSGHFSATPWATATGSYIVQFPGSGLGGNTSLRSGLLSVGLVENGGFFVDDPFSLSAILIQPGSVLANDRQIHFDMVASLQTESGATSNGARPYITGSSTAGLVVQFSDITTPDGINWSSALNGGSGTFLSSPVPLPSSLLLLTFAIANLFGKWCLVKNQ